MRKTGDLNLVKEINKSIVLDYIRHQSPISRARIAELAGLTKATVSSLVNELIGSRLVQEIGAGASSGGRKPMMLLFNGTAGYSIGVDLGVDYILVVLTDLSGRIVFERRHAHANTSVERVIDALKAAIREAADQAPASAYGIIGIGIGIPGISDGQGRVLFAPNLGWENVPLGPAIEEAFGVPVVIDNEANAGAVGELQFGTGQAADNLVYLSIGSGIGTGIVLNKELYRGSSGFSGEFGHTSIELEGKPCRCGNRGCWELYASESALLEEARKQLEDRGLDVGRLIRLAEQGDEAAIRLFERWGFYLGIGIVNIMNGINPGLIVIGGKLAEAEQWLKAPLLAAVERRSMPYPRAGMGLKFSGLGARSTVLGACSFAISKFFASTKVLVN
ncbi:ROK family transcriptional regulator [Paenibacillus ginsengihumi]|uniref:ROK family transcriptional regulator n=1 Tax=Paenibacillus ginsengihumi TaxID=431596 RepID=UPI0003603D5B|nr:ROK family transcriptional regulator [Paenibacillus ginsengihumi]